MFLASILVFSGFTLAFSQVPTNSTSTTSTTSDGRMVNTVAIVTLIDPDRTVPSPKPGVYSYIFEACAGSQEIIGPEVIVSSPSESKKIKLSLNLMANECQTSVAKIKSPSKEEISAVVVERGGVSQIIKSLENSINEIKEQLRTEKTNLSNLIKETPKPQDFSRQVTDITSKIVELRADLKDARENYYRTLYLLYS